MAETTEELLARISKKYGVPDSKESSRPSAPPPNPAPQPQPQPQPEKRSLLDVFRSRTKKIDEAAGYSCGGKINHMAQGGKIKGPGTPTSDSIGAEVQDTGEPIKVSTEERILSEQQDEALEAVARQAGFKSLDAWLESLTGTPVGPTIKGGVRAAATGMGPEDPDKERMTGFYRAANADLGRAVYGIADNILPVTRTAMNTAATEAEGRFKSGDYAGSAGRVLRGALETAGGLPLDAYEYVRRGLTAAVPTIASFGSGLANIQKDTFSTPNAAASTGASSAPSASSPAVTTSAGGVPGSSAVPSITDSLTPGKTGNAAVGSYINNPSLVDHFNQQRASDKMTGGIKMTLDANGRPVFSGGAPSAEPGRSAMDIYRSEAEIRGLDPVTFDPIRSPSQGVSGISKADTTGLDEARSRLNNAIAHTTSDPKGQRERAALMGQLASLEERAAGQALQRDQFAQSGDIRRAELDLAGSQANAQTRQRRQEYADRADNNALTRDIGRLELGQKQQLADLTRKALDGDQQAIAQLTSLNRANKGVEDKVLIAPTATTDALGNVTKGYDIVNASTGQRVGGSGGKPAPIIPQGAIDMLKKDPKLAASFDAKYGPGASSNYLR